MRRALSVLGAAGVLVTLAGCRQFLDSKNLKHNPNDPAVAPTSALFVAAQIDFYSQEEGQLGRTIALWTEQFSGQTSPFNTLGSVYQYGADDYYDNWSRSYDGGGLIDLRTIEQRSLVLGDSIFAGQAYVLEAMAIGQTADIWGDIPYSQASQPGAFPHPKADPQQVVYDSLLKSLATAIRFLADTNTADLATNAGAGTNDFTYGGLLVNVSLGTQSAAWIALAHTLRARIFMHMAAKLGATMYDSALTNASLGISDPTGAGDYVTEHNATATTANIWSDFMSVYPGTIVAGQTMVNLMNASSDPRLPAYWTPATGNAYVGAPYNVIVQTPVSQLSATRSGQTFSQPIVTYAENTLILAEASCQLGNAPNALTYLQQEQTAAGVTPVAKVSLQAIVNEKYIALFQNLETWNDYKRTGFPVLEGTPPRRLTYPFTEREANPNIPPDGARNWNDTGPVSSNCG
jgi:Starch-binding associating with outer membrane/Susd and RagB outer membrane lipoprotein